MKSAYTTTSDDYPSQNSPIDSGEEAKEEGKVDEAIALWEKMCKQNPGVNAGTVGLATTYAEQKKYDKALPYFEQLVKSQPENEEFKRGLAEAKKALAGKQP